MKFGILVALILSSLTGMSQKITQSEIDKFTKQRRIETSQVWLKNRFGGGLAIYFRSVDSSVFVTFYGFGAAADVIGVDDKAIFLFDNDQTVTVYSTGIQSYDIGKYNHTYHHQYRCTWSDLEILAKSNVKSIRKYGVGGYVDIDIPEKHQDDIAQLASVMIKEFAKYQK